MPEAPLPAALGPVLGFLDLAGIAVFALSGALLAAEKRQTLVTFLSARRSSGSTRTPPS